MSKAQIENFRIASPRIDTKNICLNSRLINPLRNINHLHKTSNRNNLSKITINSIEGISLYNKILSSGSTSLDTHHTNSRNNPKGFYSLSTNIMNFHFATNPINPLKTNPSYIGGYKKYSNPNIGLTSNKPLNSERMLKFNNPIINNYRPLNNDKAADILSAIAGMKIESMKHSLSLLFNFNSPSSKRQPLSTSKDKTLLLLSPINSSINKNDSSTIRLNSTSNNKEKKITSHFLHVNKVKSISKRKKLKNQNHKERFLEYLNKELIEKKNKKELHIQFEKMKAIKNNMNKYKILHKIIIPPYLGKKKKKGLGNNAIEYKTIKKKLLNELVINYDKSIIQFLNEEQLLYTVTFITKVNISAINSYHNTLLNHYFYPYEAIIAQFQELTGYRYNCKKAFLQQYKISKSIRPKERAPIVESTELIKHIFNDTNKFCLKNQLFINGLVNRESCDQFYTVIRIKTKTVQIIDSAPESKQFKRNKSVNLLKRRNATHRKSLFRLNAQINLHLNSNIHILKEKELFKLTGHNCEFNTLFKNNHLFQSMDDDLSPSKKRLKTVLEKEIFRDNTKKMSYFAKPLIDKKTFDYFIKIILEQNEELFKYNYEYYISKHDIDSTNEKGNTLLSIATQENQTGICDYLIQQGANVNIPNNYMNIPLHYAVAHKNNLLTNILILNHSNEHFINNKGYNPWQCINETCER